MHTLYIHLYSILFSSIIAFTAHFSGQHSMIRNYYGATGGQQSKCIVRLCIVVNLKRDLFYLVYFILSSSAFFIKLQSIHLAPT